MLTRQVIHDSIIKLRHSWVSSGTVSSIESINRGLCYSFAEELIFDILSAEEGYSLMNNNENFMYFENDSDEFGEWDVDKLSHAGICPPQGLSWKQISSIDFGYHVWIFFDGMYYDAETPQGVRSFFDLPLYREIIANYNESNLPNTCQLVSTKLATSQTFTNILKEDQYEPFK